ncbi:MAG: hypothetical protein J7K75_10965 [Desulfuromonas sp.]|nr:hypothetical protein [Desulfuromonas sp.]
MTLKVGRRLGPRTPVYFSRSCRLATRKYGSRCYEPRSRSRVSARSRHTFFEASAGDYYRIFLRLIGLQLLLFTAVAAAGYALWTMSPTLIPNQLDEQGTMLATMASTVPLIAPSLYLYVRLSNLNWNTSHVGNVTFGSSARNPRRCKILPRYGTGSRPLCSPLPDRKADPPQSFSAILNRLSDYHR